MTAMAQIFAGGRSDPHHWDELNTILNEKQILNGFSYDIRSAIAIAAQPLSTGIQTITAPNISWRPKAALILAARWTTNDTLSAHATTSIGFVTASDARSMGNLNVDNVTTTVTRRLQQTAASRLLDTDESTEIGQATFDDFVNGGIKLDWQDVDASNAWKLIVLLFGGTDLRAKSGVLNIGSSGTPVVLNDIGFKPSFGFFNSIGLSGDSFGGEYYGLGLATRTEQRAGISLSIDAQATSSPRAIRRSNACTGKYTNWSGTVSNFKRTGLDFTATGTAEINNKVIYLLLNVGDRDVWLDTLNSFTSAASDWQISDPTFEPQLVGLLHSMQQSVDVEDTGTNAGNFGFSFAAAESGNEATYNHLEEDAAGTTNTGNVGDAVFLNVRESIIQTNREFLAENLQYTAQGFEIAAADITTADATTRKWFGFALETNK